MPYQCSYCKQMIKNTIYALSGNNFQSMLFAFMLVVIATEYMKPKSIIVSVLLYIFAIAIVLRPLVDAYDINEDNNIIKGEDEDAISV